MPALHAASTTCVGRRATNQDAALTRPDLGLLVVADGMGGYAGGELASALAIEAVEAFFEANASDAEVTWPFRGQPGARHCENVARVAIDCANRRVRARRQGPLSQMGSTLALVAVCDGLEATIAHVGDSRVYLLRDGALTALTRDHSLLEEMLEAGLWTGDPQAFPHANVITRAVGMKDALEPTIQTTTLAPGDRLLLCSDGLSGVLDASTLHALLAAPEPPERVAEALVSAALDAGSRDNITAVVAFVEP